MNKLISEIKLSILQDVACLFERIRLFNQTPNSYEEWLNWELYLIFKNQGFDVDVRPRYEEKEFKKFADLLVSKNDKQALIEVKIAHSHTQDKYIWEIDKDAKALEAESTQDYERILLLFLSSNYALINKDQDWKEWLEQSEYIDLNTSSIWYEERLENGSDALYFIQT